MAAVEAYDAEAFTNAVIEFDSITKLDAWKTSILLKIKNGIKKATNETNNDDDDGEGGGGLA